MARPPRPRADPQDEVRSLVGEPPLDLVSGLGATVAVTATRVVIVRYGAMWRPRNGLRAWPHGEVDVRLEAPKRGSGRIVMVPAGARTPPRASDIVSVFIASPDWPAAERLAEVIRREAVSARRAQRVDAIGPVRTRPAPHAGPQEPHR